MPERSHRTAALLAAAGLATAGAFATAARADTARRFVHTTEADFEGGEAEGFSVTAYGELVPVPAYEELPAPPEEVETLLALARVGDTLYAAGGTATGGARVLKLADDAWEVAAEVEEAQAFCLHAMGDTLLVGLSAADGGSRVAALGEEGLEPVVNLPDDRYVWDLAGGADGVPLLIATGTEGRVLSADPDAVAAGDPDAVEVEVVLDSAQTNVLRLAASPGGFPVYAGTDTDGLVYRIAPPEAPEAPEGGDGPLLALAFFDAPEPEIGALAVAPDGRVYAGTADAEQARPGRMDAAASDSTGRPDDSAAEELIGDSNAPEVPPTEPAPEELAAGDAPPEEATQEPTPAPESDPAPEEEASEEDPEAEAEEPPAPDSTPTEADYDALRETLREKLAEARETGELEIEGVAAAAAAPKASRPRTPDQPAAEKKEGNAVYELLEDGSFREVFRESSTVLSLAIDQEEDRLLVGTGGEGQLHGVDLGDGTVTTVRDLESRQVTALLAGAGGAGETGGVAVAASNPAAAGTLPGGDASGEPGGAVYTSATLDAGRRALFGRLGVVATGPDGATFLVETRSGATLDPESAPWGDWAEAGEVPANDPAASVEVPSDPARFLRYRLTLTGGGEAAEDSAPLAVEEVTISYAVPNLAPRLSRLVVEPKDPEEAGDAAPAVTPLNWEASDPDEDALSFTVEWRAEGADRWMLAAEGLTDTSLEWATRGLADGRYTVRVTATDAPANPPGSERTSSRRSDPFLLDQTAPVLEAQLDGERITGTVTDAAGAVAGVSFRVDDEAGFRPVNAEDLLFDSPEEAFTLPLGGLDLDPSEPHLVTLRAVDTRGNASFTSVALPAGR